LLCHIHHEPFLGNAINGQFGTHCRHLITQKRAIIHGANNHRRAHLKALLWWRPGIFPATETSSSTLLSLEKYLSQQSKGPLFPD